MNGMSGMGGGWVRTSNPQNAKAFAEEQRLQQERRLADAERSRARRREAVEWIRTRWRRFRDR